MSEKTVLEVKWNELENISEEMEENTENINTNIKNLQQSLINLKIGAAAWSTNYFEVQEGPNLNKYKVGFCKHSYEWKFAIRKVDNSGNLVGRMFPLVESSRLLRIRSCKIIHEILDNMISKSTTFVNSTKDANDILTDQDFSKKLEELELKINQ